MFYQKTVLDNGLTILTERMEAVRSVALGFWVRVGNRDESPELFGMSHFMEHMLFKGTGKRSALDISTAFDSMGAELNAFTSREYTCFYARMIDEHMSEGFEVLADMICDPAFAADMIRPEREVVIEEIARSQDAPDDQVYDVFADALLPTHPLGRPVLGNPETVSSFNTEMMLSYHKKHYTAANITICACGNVDHEKVVELAQEYLSLLNAGVRKVRNDAAETKREHLSVVQKDTEQAHVLYGMPSVSQFDDHRYAYSLLDTALGGSMSSRLFQEIREKRGLVYSVYTSTQFYEDAGNFSMYAGTRPDNIEEVLEIAREQFAQVASKGLDEEELSRACELACGNFVLGMESTRSHMVRLGRMATMGVELSSIDEAIAKYRAVTAEDVARAASDLLTKKPTIAVVSPYSLEEIERVV